MRNLSISLALLGCFFVCGSSCQAKPAYRAVINQVSLELELAQTPAERSKGLMHRESLSPDQGMLFVFPYQAEWSFWMKNTRIPLSIAFLDERGVIVNIEEMEPFSLDQVWPTRPVLYAIEVNQGWFKAAGITPGMRVEFSEPLIDRIEARQ